MFRLLCRTLCFALFVFGISANLSAQVAAFLPDELVVKIKPEHRSLCTTDGVQLPALNRTLAAFGACRLETKFKTNAVSKNGKVDLSLVYTVKFDKPVDILAVKSQLERTKTLVYAEPLYYQQAFGTYTPDDPMFGQQWMLTQIKAPEGWFVHQGDTNVVIGVIDTGIWWAHPDLSPNVKYNYADPINGADDDADGYTDNFHGWDMVGVFATDSGDNDPAPASSLTNIHGTVVTGLAAASTDNAVGVAGAGFKCKFLPVKTTTDSGNTGILIRAYEGVKYAADHGATIINCSFGATTSSSFEQDIVTYASDQGAFVVSAGGNQPGNTLYYPAGYKNTFAVAGSNLNDVVTTTYHCNMDVSAPGGAVSTNFDFTNPNNLYFSSSGVASSYATAITSGCAAIVKAKYPNYSPEQVGERLRATADDTYAANPTTMYPLLGRGRINLERALTLTTPSVRLVDYTTTDGNNNILEPGETFNFVGKFTNYLDPAANVSVKAIVSDPYLSVVTANATLGGLTTFQTKFNTTSPLKFAIAANVPQNYTLCVSLEYKDGTTYTDIQCVQLTLNPTFVNLDINNLQASLSFSGEWGYNNGPQGMGLGLNAFGEQTLYEGGLLLGSTPDKLVNNMRTTVGQDQDFVSIQSARVNTPGAVSDQEGFQGFSDANAPAPFNVDFRLTTAAFSQAPNNQYIILRYSLKNRNLFGLSAMRFGMYADFDFGNNTSNDSASYDAANQMVYGWGSEQTPALYTGIVALTAQGTAVNATLGANSSSIFTDSAKFVAISSGANPLPVSNADVLMYLAEGQIGIPPLDSVFVGFALVCGKSVAELQAAAQTANQKYQCLYGGGNLTVKLGNDTTACRSVTINGATAGAVGYLWSNNDTTPQITVTESGSYSLTVLDAVGCTAIDQVKVTIIDGLTPNVAFSDTVINIAWGEPFNVTDNSAGANNWNWNFGDGFGSFSQNATHLYDSVGTYEVVLVHSNGLCSDTIRKTIQVVNNAAAGESLASAFKIYPNPTNGSVYISPNGINEQAFSVKAFNQLGQLVAEQRFATGAEAVLDLSNQPAGLYSVQITTESGVWAKKISLKP